MSTNTSLILYDAGKRVGEISDWSVAALPPIYKNVLGKSVLSTPANDECTFVSPKPVTRKSQLVVIEDGKWEITLRLVMIKGGTAVTAKITSKVALKKS
ncbi:MAG: hypothetical protein H7326_11040 [Bdellovibrionaceae bacterium]|nr:hypothetical protein [Pseudobdellovibrionaceae bacterium]